jgi:restriction endonuclease Mrr
MPPAEFEDYIADLYNGLGYKTEVVGGSHGGGINIIAKKNNITHFIQCKKFITAKVTLPDIRDFYGALADHLFGTKGIFITTNVFTTEAEQFVKDKPIELIDSNKLVSLIKFNQKNKKAIAQGGLLCPKCNGRLLKRIGKHGSFLRCENFPVCMYTEKINN